MSRNKMISIAMGVCAVIVALAVLVSVTDLFGKTGFGYASAEKYSAGSAQISGTVKNLDINWINGKVNLEYHSGSGIELRETSSKPISADMQLRWWLDGDTLRIQYAKSGFRLVTNQEKELTVSLPESAAFNEVSIRATSADLNLPALQAEALRMEVTSGDILAEAAAKSISAGATSGDMRLTITGRADSVTAGTTSGSIAVEAGSVSVLKASSTSGGILLTAEKAEQCDAGSTSGTVTVEIGESSQVEISSTSGSIHTALSAFSSLKAHSTSGRIEALLPEQPGFTASISTTSGSIDYTLPLSRQGDRYVCGDGSGKVELSATSGNIQLAPVGAK